MSVFRRFRAGTLAGAVGALLLSALTATPAAHAATVSDCSQWGVTTLQSGAYKYQQNEWNSTATQCASIDDSTGAWSITQANFGLPTNGAPATYPSSYKGCHWGNCTSGSGLPIQVSQLSSATTSVNTTQVGSGAYDVAYDIWFNSTPTTSGQPDGTELMIWLNSRGGVQPFGSQTATASIDGMNWAVWTGQQSSWKIISYRLNPGGTSFSNLDVKALINDAVSRGSLNPAHYLIDSEFGFEIWQGGQGLGVTSYAFQAQGGGGGGDTSPPTAPSNLAVTGTSSNSVSLSWGASTDDVGVTAYDVYQGSTVVATVTGNPPATSATVTGLSPNTTYSFTVKARDAAGNVSQSSNTVGATTSGSTGGGGSWAISLQAISPNPTHVGTVTNVTVDFKNTASTSANNVTLTVTLVNASGAAAGSQSWSGQNIASQQTLNETYSWNPPATGGYTVQATVTDSGGATLASNGNVGTATVQ
ncbi:MAG TPA: fibronectin type III domain-containing protein [Actinocrinis sp.]|uniref:GH12 family glycosyl hydrolase domain-containing protein n=1 Tax=Actinocrinis sp. TaxID=1920516 RepID=UPI002DDCF668|nr:fibronectin type III domain-containing protein [Actinocrinis sp.]HEV2342644.1 fibronectin type III domain-containing protein [Actinocrinis sp.]